MRSVDVRLAARVVVVALSLLIVGSAFDVGARSLRCPARDDVVCIPGAVADRVVCAEENEILEYPNPTAFCLACHDLNVKEGRPVAHESSVPSMKWVHPLEIRYPEGRSRFMPVEKLYAGIRLAHGRISCSSCHSGSKPEQHYTSVHARNPNLCSHCHYR